MAFFQKIISYVANQVLVEGLANSRTFQQFAIRSDKAMKELAKKGKDAQAEISQKATSFNKTFQEELDKGMQEMRKESASGKKS
ncbi:hypothetical protein CYMTET_17272 [Cymbomonas tetramitiformis]|uniref:Uncharacterized protein n=1 Tax=Cymbomonas tetramitiformis TaxID=36881 RepID=A0AAE0GAE6_9CHLO|nr:hypothetical protein CYMTET_17272 [Cymbomonas tetramitiformis]